MEGSLSRKLETYCTIKHNNAFCDHVLKEMEKLVDEGLVKAIGLSNFNKNQVQRIWENCKVKPSNLQVKLHICLTLN